MSYTIRSAAYANSDRTAVIIQTEEAGAVLVSQVDQPDGWADLLAWGVPDDYAEPPVPRRMVAKSVVTQRVIDAGKIDQAMAMLQMNWAKFARWVAPDQPAVFFDDPDTIAMVEALDLDPEVIMAEV